MAYKTRKTDTNETSGGFHNKTCHFKGSSVKWSIDHSDLDGIAYFHTKRDADDIAEYANSINWDLTGDIVAMFKKHLVKSKNFQRLDSFKGEA